MFARLHSIFATKLPESLAGLRRGFQTLVPTSRGAEEASTAARRTEARLCGGWCCPSVRRLFRLPGCLGIYSGHPVGSSHSGQIRDSKSAAGPGIKMMWMKIYTNHYKLVCVISMYTRILISFYLPIVIRYIPVPAGRTVIQDAVWQKCQAKELCCSEAKKLAQQCLDFLRRMVEEWRAAQKVQNQQPTEARAGECIHWGLELGERNLGCLRPRHHESCPLAAAAKNCFRKSSFSCGVKMRYVVEYLPGC